MTPRLLILTAGYGEGHNAAARALAEAWRRRHGECSACVADVFEQASPRLNRVSRRGYLALINRMPRVWSLCYRWLDHSASFPALARMLSDERRELAHLLTDEVPDVICSTYPVYAYLLQQLSWSAAVKAPHFNIVTDSISINSLWWRAGADGWFVPNEDSAEVMRGAGVDRDLIHDEGFPVAPVFHDLTGQSVLPSLAQGARPRVLFIINSGTRGAADGARKLLRETAWDITCTVGRNDVLRRELESLAAERVSPTRILGWTDQIPSLLLSHHVVISKAGGATTQEALAARCPMVVNQIVPGQEEGNYELLRRHGIGALAQTPDEVVAALQRAFADDGVVWSQWRRALEPLARPDAAVRIADRVLSLTEKSVTSRGRGSAVAVSA
jgi:processive 1,2-diacylglycerol beta-glucosyltransferase